MGEILSANLVYQSDHEIGSTILSCGSNGEDHDDSDHGDNQVLGLGKEGREKQKAQGKGET
jgi:hypothetical protein